MKLSKKLIEVALPLEAINKAAAKPAWEPNQEMNRDTSNLVSGRGYGFSLGLTFSRRANW